MLFMKATKKSKFKMSIKDWEIFFLSLPGLLFIFIFSYLPMPGIILAFKEYSYSKGIAGSKFVGFDNFRFFFQSQDALRVTKNVIFLNTFFIVTTVVISVGVAILLFEIGKKGVKIFQTALFFPYFLSWIVVSYIVYAFLNAQSGVLNQILALFNKEAVLWYNEPKYWTFMLIIINLWKVMGYNTIIYYTGLMGIDSSIYEAAIIDGANKVQQVFKITVPLLMPLIVMLVTLAIGKIFYSDFGLFFFVTKDSSALYSVTDVIDTYVYRALKVSGDIGMGAAVGLYQSVVGLVLILVTNFIIKKYNEENALF